MTLCLTVKTKLRAVEEVKMEGWKGYTGGLPGKENMQEMLYLKISVIVT